MTTTAQEEARYAELQAMALDAARQGDEETLEPMLEAGMPVNLRDEKGNTLLMLASYHGHAKATWALLRRDAEVDARNDRNQTPLAGVAFKGHLDIAKLLLDAGADPVADQGGGRTPVMFAAMFGHLEMVKLLEASAVKQGWRKSSLGWLARVMAIPRVLFFRKLMKPAKGAA
ncbi:ankyrin repeat domain-containing protein [Haloferula sp. BvORR071]|uniref:ankyrin repeat domain-containing protein n=1 Tax=Haloferula sp. BvORR071 TaxID=1396141 RepID=UPI0005547FBD|nr:ankyrin repeat domain-containing protein [Haloferula sp. BvORR071]